MTKQFTAARQRHHIDCLHGVCYTLTGLLQMSFLHLDHALVIKSLLQVIERQQSLPKHADAHAVVHRWLAAQKIFWEQQLALLEKEVVHAAQHDLPGETLTAPLFGPDVPEPVKQQIADQAAQALAKKVEGDVYVGERSVIQDPKGLLAKAKASGNCGWQGHWPLPYDRVRFTNAGGHDWQQQEALKAGLLVDQIYYVADCETGDWSSSLSIVDVLGGFDRPIKGRFNTALFDWLDCPQHHHDLNDGFNSGCPTCGDRGYVIVEKRNMATLSPSDSDFVQEACERYGCRAGYELRMEERGEESAA